MYGDHVHRRYTVRITTHSFDKEVTEPYCSLQKASYHTHKSRLNKHLNRKIREETESRKQTCPSGHVHVLVGVRYDVDVTTELTAGYNVAVLQMGISHEDSS